MDYQLSEENRKWAEKIYGLMYTKTEKECLRVKDMIPDVPEGGRYHKDMGQADITNWTNGFWGGILWQMYHACGSQVFRAAAEKLEERLDRAFDVYAGLHHDVGFMWLPTAVADYKITGNQRSRTRGLHAANLLAGRFNPRAGFIRAWNPHVRGGKMEDCTGWMIVDSLMNLPILYWAAQEAHNPAYSYIAQIHADTALKYILREDGSCKHIAVVNPENGELIRIQEGQGYSVDSAWTRGQAWAVYGFATSAKHTKNPGYLSAAKKAANYFIACASRTGYITPCDFRSPAHPFLPDTSAGVCAACGMLEMAEQLTGSERNFYVECAVDLLRAAEKQYADWNMEEDGLLTGSRGAYHSSEPEEGRSFIFGDYYFVEGVLRLAGKHLSIW